MKVYVLGCDKQNYLIPVFTGLMSEYWPKCEIVILTYGVPKLRLPDNCSVVTLNKKDNVKNWANDLRRYFKSVSDDYFALLLVDYLLTKKVDWRVVEWMESYMRQGEIVKMFLAHHGGRYGKVVDTYRGYHLVDIGDKYRKKGSLGAAIWRRDYLLKLLEPGLTPWSFEKQCNRVIGSEDVKVYGNKHFRAYKTHILSYADGSHKKRLNIEALSRIDKVVFARMFKSGLFDLYLSEASRIGVDEDVLWDRFELSD